MQTKIHSPADIPAAISVVENAFSQSREDTTLFCLVSEELLRDLFSRGCKEVTIRTRTFPFPYAEITARPPEQTPVLLDETARLEAEIRRSLLHKYDSHIAQLPARGMERYRVRPAGKNDGDIGDEILEFYQNEKNAPAKSMAVLSYLAKRYRLLVSLSMVNKTVKHLCALLLPVFASNIIGALSICHSFWDAPVLWNVFGSALALAINLVCATLDNAVYQRFTRRVETGFKMALVRKLQILSTRFHKNTSGGKVLSKLVSDVQFVKLLINENLINVLHLAIDIVFVIVISIHRMPVMLLFYAVVIPLSSGILRHFLGPLRESKADMRRKAEANSAAFKEMLAMDSLTRAEGLQKAEYENLSGGALSVQSAADYQDRLQIRLNNAGYGVSQGFRLLCLCVAVSLCFAGRISVASVVLFQSLFDTLINSMQRFLDSMPQITQGLDSLDSIHELLSERDIESSGDQHLALPVRGEIKFQDVVYGYDPKRPSVLNGVSFSVPAGSSAAFIGRSGAGKSTILGLMIGLYAPESGRVLIDGCDLALLDKNDFRSHIALVPQQSVLFSGTLWDNLVYGLRYVSTEKVMEVLNSVGLSDLYDSHPDGLMRPVFEGGENLSGGQRQRISIARALLRDPAVILFDEPTSALDSESEKEVQQAIEALLGKCTVILVAHRLNTLSHVDAIYEITEERSVRRVTLEEVRGDAHSS
ncbi:MAG: ABC transporter ATP-binding protein/permease [Clostridiales bacterium]|nr:ABC transporter ATP-binding protein/permease [Clostridiales bacterium]